MGSGFRVQGLWVRGSRVQGSEGGRDGSVEVTKVERKEGGMKGRAEKVTKVS